MQEALFLVKKKTRGDTSKMYIPVGTRLKLLAHKLASDYMQCGEIVQASALPVLMITWTVFPVERLKKEEERIWKHYSTYFQAFGRGTS